MKLSKPLLLFGIVTMLFVGLTVSDDDEDGDDDNDDDDGTNMF